MSWVRAHTWHAHPAGGHRLREPGFYTGGVSMAPKFAAAHHTYVTTI